MSALTPAPDWGTFPSDYLTVLINEKSNVAIDINDSLSLSQENGTDIGEIVTHSEIVWSFTTVLLVTFFSLLIVVTIVGNILVCLSVILVRKLRKPQNYLLVSLAVSDLFVALFVMPLCVAFEVHEGIWPLNEGLCDLWVSADVLCCTASILNLCAISTDRYRAITTPLEYSSKTTPRRMFLIIFVVWLLSACVSLPPVLLLGNVHEDMIGRPFCSVSQDFWYQIYATMASFYVPLLVMFVVYFKILRVVAEKKKQMSWKKEDERSFHHRNSSSATTTTMATTTHIQPLLKKDSVSSQNSHYIGSRSSGSPLLQNFGNGHCNGHQGNGHTVSIMASLANGNVATTTVMNNNKEDHSHPQLHFFPMSTLHRIKKEKLFGGLKEHKASTVLGIIMSAFVICWLPFFILAIMRPFLTIHGIEIPPWISSLFNWLGYANSALNPLIYATLNRDFRRPFKEILCFRCATLDTLMRREFYQEQYGDDRENRERRASRAHFHHIHQNTNIHREEGPEEPVAV